MKVNRPFRLTMVKGSGEIFYFDNNSNGRTSIKPVAPFAQDQSTPFRLTIVRAGKST